MVRSLWRTLHIDWRDASIPHAQPAYTCGLLLRRLKFVQLQHGVLCQSLAAYLQQSKGEHGLSTRRIVVTGMGLVSPLGCDVESAWKRLLNGHSGLTGLPDDVTEGIASKVGGVVPPLTSDCPWGFDPALAVEPKDQKKMDRFSLFALAAAQEALNQSCWRPETETARQRTATIVASGVGGFGAIVEAVRTTDNRGPRRLSPFTVPSFLANMAAGHVSIRHGFRGPLGAPITACAASAQAIGDAARLIRAGEADIAVCGGAEACIDRVSLGTFAAARTMSTGFNDRPACASRPFDTERDGFVMGEGAGMLVIEELEHALRRGATPIAELVGYGTSADAHHMTSPPEDGAGGRRAMELAIQQANLAPEQIGHLNAHATSTPVGDVSELAAIKAVFGMGRGPALSATKSSTGHLLGAAGGVEAIFTILALRDQIAPPTLNLTQPDPVAEGVDIVSGSARKISTEYAISNGFGFGGVNASLVLRRH
ncbi:3-oxoacyl-[acyl-carrier-protein] synthase II [Paraburkholderia youngii]